MFRYWNGATWSAQLSPSPTAPSPSGGLGQPGSYGSQSGSGTQAPHFGQAGYQPGQQHAPQQQPAKRGPGLWIGIGVGVVVLGLVAWLVIRFLGGSGIPTLGSTPGANSSTNPCPTQKVGGTPPPHPNDGRVYGGALSYPRLGSPWSAPSTDIRVPFGRDVRTQTVTIEPNYDKAGSNWVASVLVGELTAGDGFYSPREGSEIVVKCLLGAFYGGAEVTRDDKVSEARTLDGKDAWLTETHLSFNIPGLKAKGETAIVLIVATSAESSSLFYASVPDNATQYLQPSRDAMAALKVGA